MTYIITQDNRVGHVTSIDAEMVFAILEETRADGGKCQGEEVFLLDEVTLIPTMRS